MDKTLDDYFKELKNLVSIYEDTCKMQIDTGTVASDLNLFITKEIQAKIGGIERKIHREVLG